MFKTPKNFSLGIGLVVLAACAQQQASPVGIEPTFDKYGGALCPPSYVLVGDVCLTPEESEATGYSTHSSSDVADGGTPGGSTSDGDSTGQEGNTSQNQNQNNNQNRNQNQGASGS